MRTAIMLVGAVSVQACGLPPESFPRQPTAIYRAAPLPAPYGWQIWPITRSAMFTGSGSREIVYLICYANEASRLFYWVPPDAPRSGKMTLVSQSSSTSLEPVDVAEDRAPPPPSETGNAPLMGLIIGAAIPKGDPVMASFVETGELTLIWGRYSLSADIRPEQLSGLRRNCGR
ncbi:MAG: hypothetical protein ABIN83_02295 [Sphingomicrobium sp.]